MAKHKPIKFETTLEPTLKKQIEETIQENKKAKNAFNAVLALAAVGGVLTLGVMAPGVFGELTRFLYKRKKEKYQQYQLLWHNFNLLKKRGNLEFVREENGCLVYKFTDKGKERIRKFVFDELSLKNLKRWDRKWRLVIFDIPERNRKARVSLREKLREMGFYQCQKSVWIHPFHCAEELEFLKDFFNIKPYVKLFVVEEMTDGKVLYHFSPLLKKVITE
jgi:DNA-binding PadR family transcriptional regulator